MSTKATDGTASRSASAAATPATATATTAVHSVSRVTVIDRDAVTTTTTSTTTTTTVSTTTVQAAQRSDDAQDGGCKSGAEEEQCAQGEQQQQQQQQPTKPKADEGTIRLKGVIFDMDGTLTMPGLIDFQRIRLRIGLLPTQDIIASLKHMEEDRRKLAWSIIEEEEYLGIERCELQAGLHDLFQFLQERGIPTGLLTRNALRAVEHFMQLTGLRFAEVLTRDSAHGFKPSPAPCLYISRQWGLEPSNVLMVGDAQDDLASGNSAGCFTCLLVNAHNRHLVPKADFAVHSLAELQQLIARFL